MSPRLSQSRRRATASEVPLWQTFASSGNRFLSMRFVTPLRLFTRDETDTFGGELAGRGT